MMKCKIVHNEGVIFIFLLAIITGSSSSYLSNSQSIQELCSSNRYIYTIRSEEPQQLRLTYNISSLESNKWYQKSKHKCRKEFKTNNGASHFVIVMSNMSIPSCSEKCHCNYFEIAEPGNSEKFCGEHREAIYFESKSDYLSIDFQHDKSMRFEVNLEFTVVRNTYIITGQPKSDPFHSGHFIETPYFPNTYQSDYTAEYIFHTDASDGCVMLLFLDFQIAPASYIEVVGHNGTIPGRFHGDIFRPPVFVSQENKLSLKFEANRQPGSSGFRAVSFFLKNSEVPFVQPYTDCGGLKYGYGGAIILDNLKNKSYDCLWQIVTPFLPQTKYFLTVSNITLERVGPKTTLEFREGQNSKSKIVKNIDCSDIDCSLILSEVTVSAYNGLYIRFIGEVNSTSFIGMVFTSYHIGNCSSEKSNCEGRCLHPNLICDGIQHCSDGSDEFDCTKPTTAESVTPAVVKKTSKSSRAEASFYIIVSIGVTGIVFLILAILLFYKTYKAANLDEEMHQSEVISEMAGPLPRTYSMRSTYFDNLPPSYDDFIQASDLYPPLLYTRAAKRHSEPYITRNNIRTTSFCGRSFLGPRSIQSSVDVSSHCVPLETILPEEAAISPEPSCSFETSSFDWHIDKPKLQSSKSALRRAWSSDSKLNDLNTSDCDLHLSITHCIYPNICRECSPKQYYSLPLNFRFNRCKDSNIDIIFPENAPPKIFNRNRHLSLHDPSYTPKSKILTIKTRCHSDPCQFSVHYSLH